MCKNSKVHIVEAKRTPQGRFLGKLSACSPVDLAVAAGETVLQGKDPSVIDQIILGNVLAAGQGMNIARQVGLRLPVRIDVPAFTINMMCASGMQAVILGAQAILSGSARAVLCGGSESMSTAPFLLERARAGYRLGDGVLVDVLLRDGLIDPLTSEHMGLTAERLAEEMSISRAEQDSFALSSQQKYERHKRDNTVDREMAKLPYLDFDEHPRPDTDVASLAALNAIFKDYGTVTAGNSSGINDGAAMLLLCSDREAERQGWVPLASFEFGLSIGCEPSRMGLGPVWATEALCRHLGRNLSEYPIIEMNEAFAAQTIACLKKLKIAITDPRVNPNGGAIAIGHPIGSSGARLIVTIVHEMVRRNYPLGLATLCVGGGMGLAVSLSREI